MKFSRYAIPAPNVASLSWCGDTLIDFVRGGICFHMDGTSTTQRVNWAFPFDAASATSDGRFAIIYQRLGPKALLLHDGKLVRELNRSFYHAHVYEYPICIWQTKNGQVLIAHCPEHYNQIEIEDALNGTRLTGGTRKPADFFHSRLRVNAAGSRLLSAGWAWHPWSGVAYYDLEEALRNPAHLDALHHAPNSLNVGMAEESSACWQTNTRVLLGGSAENEDSEEAARIPEPRLHPCGIAVYDVVSEKYVKSIVLEETPGTMMAVGEDYAISFYRYPKLVSLESGKIVAKWGDLDTGTQTSSIFLRETKIPPLAIDPEHHRFAVYGSKEIHVIQVLSDS